MGIFVGALAGFLPIDALLHLANIGTLLAFVIVCAAVLIMRKKHPEAERPFRCPWVPFVPVMGVLSCLMLMFSLPVANWVRLYSWLLMGFVVYFTYGRFHSVMTDATPIPPTEISEGIGWLSGAFPFIGLIAAFVYLAKSQGRKALQAILLPIICYPLFWILWKGITMPNFRIFLLLGGFAAIPFLATWIVRGIPSGNGPKTA